MPRYIVTKGEFDAAALGHGPDWWVVDSYIAHQGEGPGIVARFETEVKVMHFNARNQG